MSAPCTVDKCELVSLALCQCCKQDLCIDHLNDHANRRNENLFPFVEKINSLVSRFGQVCDGEQSYLKQLDQWRHSAYATIDHFCEKKRVDFADVTLNQQREHMNDTHRKLNELVRKKGGSQQDLDSLSDAIQSIEQYLDKFQQLPFALPPLTINDDCILQSPALQNGSADGIPNHVTVSPTQVDVQSDKLPEKKRASEKSSKRKKKSSRHSDDSDDRSSSRRSRSPRYHKDRSRKSEYHEPRVHFPHRRP